MTVDQIDVSTPVGPARATVHPSSGKPRGTLALGHGAGGGIEARDLVALAAALPAAGITVVLVEQPWRLAGRKVAAAPAQLDIAWTAVLAELRPAPPLVVGGRSAGARVACRTARAVGARGALALAFPLHPPGRSERSRAAELLEAGVPTLVVQGERDPFGSPEEFPAGTRIAGVARGVTPTDRKSAATRRGAAADGVTPRTRWGSWGAGCPQITAPPVGRRAGRSGDDRDGRLDLSPTQFPAGTRLVAVPWADHSFGVPARAGLAPYAVTDLIVEAVLAWWPKS